MKTSLRSVVCFLLAAVLCCPEPSEAVTSKHREREASAQARKKKERPKRESVKNRKKNASKSERSKFAWVKRPGPVVRMPSRDPGIAEPNFDDPWPGVVVGPGKDMVFATVKDGVDGQWVYETEHFVLQADFDLGERTARELGRIVETAYEACLALPCNSFGRKSNPSVKKYGYFMFQGNDAFVKALGSNPMYKMVSALTRYPGIYLVKNKLNISGEASNYAIDKKRQPFVTKHEMHHLVGKGREDFGMWYIEGMGEYMGCSPYENGAIHFNMNEKVVLDYVSSWNAACEGRRLGTEIACPTSLKEFCDTGIVEFMNPARANFNYGMALLCVYYWIHLDGKGDASRLKNYVRALQERKGRQAAEAALTDGRTWENIEKEFSAKYAKLGLEITFGGQ